jgi:hypothetical protein
MTPPSRAAHFAPLEHTAEEDVEAGGRAEPRVGRGSVMTSARSKSWANADAELKRRTFVATAATTTGTTPTPQRSTAHPSRRYIENLGGGEANAVPEVEAWEEPAAVNARHRAVFERLACQRTRTAATWLAERETVAGPWAETSERVVVLRSPYAFYQEPHRWSYRPGGEKEPSPRRSPHRFITCRLLTHRLLARAS